MMFPAALLGGSMFEDRAKNFVKRAKEPDGPKVDLPEARVDGFSIEKFHVSEDAAINFNMPQYARGTPERCILPGEYTKLVEGGHTVWMSDTTAERRDHAEVYKMARELGGTALVHGLGLGMITNALLLLDNIESVEVWESSEEVIELCGQPLAERFGDRLKVVHGDVWEHRPKKGTEWTLVWHDIWPTFTSDNLKPMQRLGARFRTRCAWQGFWGRETCREMARQERNDRQRSYW
jgi:hypothetical protein